MGALDKVTLVLYQPQDVVNVGSIVRVMSNFGLRQLRLVEPAAFDAVRVEGIAHQARPIIESVQKFSTLKEAISDCGFVLGTTARDRGIRRERLTPRMATQTLLKAYNADSESTCAILFGREDDGLPNEALDFCHALVTIPTDSFNASLNLAQAALVICYELWLTVNPEIEQLHPLTSPERETAPRGAPPRYGDAPSIFSALEEDLDEDVRLASGTDREVLFEALRDLMKTLHPSSTDIRMAYSMSRLRAVILRSAPRKDESKMLAHIFQNITRKLRKE